MRGVLGLAPVDGFLQTFSNATSFSNRGVGVDYASNSDRAIVGIAANVAVATDLEGAVPKAGAALNVTLMGGLNLRRWGYPQITTYANAFWRRADSDNLRGSIASAGAHVQYKLFHKTTGWKRLVVQWGGVDLTTGLEFARWSFTLHDRLAESFEIGGTTASETIDASLGGRFRLGSKTLTIPFEVTTNVRVLYVASLYVGLGLDAQVGSTRVDVGTTGALASSAGQDIGSVAITGTAKQGPTVAGYHTLLGLQVNLWRLKLFAQATLQPVDKFSFALGTRVVL